MLFGKNPWMHTPAQYTSIADAFNKTLHTQTHSEKQKNYMTNIAHSVMCKHCKRVQTLGKLYPCAATSHAHANIVHTLYACATIARKQNCMHANKIAAGATQPSLGGPPNESNCMA